MGMMQTNSLDMVWNAFNTERLSYSTELYRTAIDWPRAHGDAHRQGLIKQALLHSWLVDVHPAIYSALSPAVAVQVNANCGRCLPVSHAWCELVCGY